MEKITIKGIHRAAKSRNHPVGSCHEIINMRFRENAWEAVGDKTLLYELPEGSLVKCVHDMTVGVFVVYAKQTGGLFYANSTSVSNTIDATGDYTEDNIVSLNNTLIVSSLSRYTVFSFDEDAMVYRELSSRIRELLVTYDGRPAQSKDYVDGKMTFTVEKNDITTLLPLTSDFEEMKNTYFETYGLFFGQAWMTYTIELFDGSEILRGPLKQVNGATLFARLTETDNRWSFNAIHNGNLYNFASISSTKRGHKFTINDYELFKSLRGYIKGINIYLSRPTPIASVFEPAISSSKNYPSTELPSPWIYEASDAIASFEPITKTKAPEIMYNVASISLSDIADMGGVDNGDGSFTAYVPLANIANIATIEKTLPVDSADLSTIRSANKPVVYNGSVFLSDINTYFQPTSIHGDALTDNFKDYVDSDYTNFYAYYFNGDLQSLLKGKIHLLNKVWTSSIGGTPVVVKSNPDILTLLSGNTEVSTAIHNCYTEGLGYYNCFANTWDANKVAPIVVEYAFAVDLNTDSGIRTVFGDICEHSGYQAAFYGIKRKKCELKGFVTYPDIRGEKMRIYFRQKGTSQWYVNELDMKQSDYHRLSYAYPELTILDSVAPSTNNTGVVTASSLPEMTYPSITEGNRVQASETNNPLSFPSTRSYRVGNSNIIALHTVNQELSQGQFGDYPIIAFTSGGIWAMAMGDGVLITAVVPLVNEVCNNANSVTSIRKGIFFTSDKGLKILQGSKAIDISDILEGSPSMPFGNIAINALVAEVGLTDAISSVDFLEYIKEAIIGYDSFFEEVIVSNPDYNYSYVYHINQNAWTKREGSFDAFINQFPHLLSINGTNVLLTNKEQRTAKNTLFITNQIGDNAYTKITEMVARGEFGRCSLNVFISQDKKQSRIGTYRNVSGASDIHLYRTPCSFKSFVVVMAGSYSETDYFTDIELSFEKRYGSKMR